MTWPAGTVAKATVGEVEHVGMFNVDGRFWFLTGAGSGRTLVVATTSSEKFVRFVATNVRPLVVLDPDDEEQMDEFRNRIHRHWGSGGLSPLSVASALRAMAPKPIPVKPDEPTRLGAVVRDGRGQHWTRIVQHGDSDGGCPWISVAAVRGRWAEIDAVEVLSPGMDPTKDGGA